MRWSVAALIAALAALASVVGATGAMARRTAALAAHMHVDACHVTEARTGDVVLFRWDGTSAAHDLVSTFSHVGIVVVRNTEPWILETHKVGDTRALGYEGDGVRAYPLEHRVQTYPGAAWLLKLDRARWHVDPRALERAFASLVNTPYDYAHEPRLASCFVDAVLGVRRSHASPKMFCSEFVGELLRRVGVLSDVDTACLTPESFAHMPDVFPHMLRL